MKIVTASVPPEIYQAVWQYKQDRLATGQKLTISEALAELLLKGLEVAQVPIVDTPK